MRSAVAQSIAALLLASGPAAAQTSASFPDLKEHGHTRAHATAPVPASETPPHGSHTADRRVAQHDVPVSSWSSWHASSWHASPSLAHPPRLALGPPVTAPWTGAAPSQLGSAAGASPTAERQPASGGTTLAVGGLLFAIPYAAGLGIAASEGFANASGWLAAPVLGPWLALTGRKDPCKGLDARRDGIDQDIGRCVAEPMVRGLLVLDGVLQATGAVMLVIGSSKEDGAKRKDVAVAAGRVGTGYGVGALGSF